MSALRSVFVLTAFLAAAPVLAQETGPAGNPLVVSGSVHVTNNGFSPIPSFSLGEPAAIAYLSVKRNRFEFAPHMSFSLAGRPWTFTYWLQYKLVDRERYSLQAGTTLALKYGQTEILEDEAPVTILDVQRVSVSQIVSSHRLSDRVSTSLSYRFGHGFDPGGVNALHFLTWATNVAPIPVGKKFQSTLNAQAFYINVDGLQGGYVSAVVGFGHNEFPVSLAYQFCQPVKTEVAPELGFVWNLSLVYRFRYSFQKEHPERTSG
ncbi:MAG: hypothetical protein R2751_18385 [Bacteroidales bacterium]